MLTRAKKILSPLAVALTAALLCCCAPAETAEPKAPGAGAGYPYAFRDSLGATVTLEQKPETVAVLFSSYAEMWTLAGGRVDITVGESIERGFAADDAVIVDETAGHSAVDLETLVAAKPDLVIGTADYQCQADAVGFCREHGIPAAAFTVESADDYLAVLRILCDITGDEEAYQNNGQAVGDRIGVLLSRVDDFLSSGAAEPPRILFIRAGSSASSTKAKNSNDNFVCAMLADLSAINIADSDGQLTGSLSTEAILVDDPEYLFITTMGDENAAKDYMSSLLETPGWRDLSCVTSGNFTFLPKSMFHFKPNARWAEAYEYLIAILYPEVSLD